MQAQHPSDSGCEVSNGDGHGQPADKETRRQRVRQSVRTFFILLAGGDTQ